MRAHRHTGPGLCRPAMQPQPAVGSVGRSVAETRGTLQLAAGWRYSPGRAACLLPLIWGLSCMISPACAVSAGAAQARGCMYSIGMYKISVERYFGTFIMLLHYPACHAFHVQRLCNSAVRGRTACLAIVNKLEEGGARLRLQPQQHGDRERRCARGHALEKGGA